MSLLTFLLTLLILITIKKALALFLSVAALAVACTNETDKTKTNADNAIGFKSFIDNPTKAGLNNSNKLEQDFGVFGYGDPIGGQLTADLVPDFMYNQQVIYSSEGFSYTPIKYWPNDGHADFYAYTPYNSKFLTFTNPTSVSSKGYPVFTYLVNSEIANQEDLLVSSAEGMDGTVGNVDLVFDHALTRVCFAVRTHADYAPNGTKIKVTSIVLSNIASGGSFSYDRYQNQPDSTWWTPNTTLVNYTPGLAVAGGVPVSFSDTHYTIVNGSNQYLLLTPQSFKDKTATLTINYDVINGGVTEAMTKTFNLNGTKTWKPRMALTYAIDISLNMVTFTASISDWIPTNQNFVVIP